MQNYQVQVVPGRRGKQGLSRHMTVLSLLTASDLGPITPITHVSSNSPAFF